MVLRETLAYYVVDGGSAFCTFLDATKAFDRIDYCKIFRELLRRDLPAIYVRLLCNLYTNNVAHVSWNGMLSKVFTIENGVKQGGIVSPVLYIYIYIYIDCIRESNVGCFIGNVFAGALAYADDIALLAISSRAMIHLLLICEQYGKNYKLS